MRVKLNSTDVQRRFLRSCGGLEVVVFAPVSRSERGFLLSEADDVV
ncbi:MAG: hypothetical protein ACYS18_02330 [Planctomycetota bacterium]